MKIENVKNNVENTINHKGSMWSSTPTTKTKIIRVGVDDHVDPSNKGITLIALIITIILMLILAGVVISLTIGENGIFETAKYAVQKNSEAEAKEKLELALADLQAHKYTNEAYNENEYIDDYLNNEKIEILGNIATVGNWDFEIDRSIPSIKSNLGASETKLTKEVKEYLGKNENDKYMVSVLVKIESNIKIESIEFENTDGTILTIVPEKDTITKDMQIELDKEYKIVLKMAEGKIQTRTIIERSVENIRTVEQLVAFRDKVNSGLTYEGKTVNLLTDLDLSSVCGANINGKEISWEPIGATDTYFAGTFDGNYHTLSKLYINDNTSRRLGLFANINTAIVQNLIMENIYEYTANTGYCSMGGIVGYMENSSIIQNCLVSGNITGRHPIGGIAGNTDYDNKIISCVNYATITANYANSTVVGMAGGIVGQVGTITIENCYNVGKITGSSSSVKNIGGIIGRVAISANIINCYNIGKIGTAKIKGAISGSLINKGVITNNYWASECGASCGIAQVSAGNSGATPVLSEDLKNYASTLGTAFENDDSNINNGYPILKWQIKSN